MNRKMVIVLAAGLMLGSLAVGQNPPEKKVSVGRWPMPWHSA